MAQPLIDSEATSTSTVYAETLGDLQRKALKVLQFECFAGAIVNATASGAIAWLVFRDQPCVPVWGWWGVITDLILGTVVASILMTLFLGAGWMHKARAGRGFVIPEGRPFWLLQWLAELPLLLRAMAIALGASAIFIPITIAALGAVGAAEMQLSTFVFLKAALGGVLGSLVSPIVVFTSVLAVNSRFGSVKICNPSAEGSDEP